MFSYLLTWVSAFEMSRRFHDFGLKEVIIQDYLGQSARNRYRGNRFKPPSHKSKIVKVLFGANN